MNTIGDYVRVAAANCPTREALIDANDGRKVTYAELDCATDRLGAGLHALGLRKGDRLACWLQTSIEYVQLYLAAAKLGLVLVPVNAMLAPDEVRFILNDSGAAALAYAHSFADAVSRSGALGHLRTICVGGSNASAEITFEQLLECTSPAPPWAASSNDLLVLGYTSGTTGFPKAAALTHASVSSVNKTNALGYRLPMASRGVYAGNMSFTASIPAFILTHFYVAGTLILAMSNEPGRVLRALDEFAGNYTSVAPPLVGEYADACAREPERLWALRSMLQGAGPARLEDVVRLNEALGGRLLTGWGMTENSGGLVTALTAQDSMRALHGEPELLGSVGSPLPGFRVSVLDERDEGSSEESVAGELCFQSASLMQGYWNRPEQTAGCLVDGWYHSGDLGRRDGEGRLYIEDRRSDLIVSGGLNVYPSEVERVLSQMPGIRDCAVIGVPHERWGRAVTAAVVSDHALLEDDVIAFCRERLASYKKPVTVKFLAELPRTVSGKVQRGRIEAALKWNDSIGNES